MSINCIEPGGNKVEAGLKDLDERQARESGPVILTTMTPEDIAKYGPPKHKPCRVCGRKLPLADYDYLSRLKRYSGICKECRAKELQERAMA